MSEALAEWLLEQIAEDERVARAAAGATDRYWRLNIDSTGDWISDFDDGEPILSGFACREDRLGKEADSMALAHAARFEPHRVLAECEAKRRIVEHVENMTGGELAYMERLRLTDIENAQYVGLRDILRLLALPYADRPGYREEWRP